MSVVDDMWATASADLAAEGSERRLALAQVACAGLWPFLAAAGSEREYEHRRALALDQVEAACDSVSPGDPTLVQQVLAGLDVDFRALRALRAPERDLAGQVQAELDRRTAAHILPWHELGPEQRQEVLRAHRGKDETWAAKHAFQFTDHADFPDGRAHLIGRTPWPLSDVTATVNTSTAASGAPLESGMMGAWPAEGWDQRHVQQLSDPELHGLYKQVADIGWHATPLMSAISDEGQRRGLNTHRSVLASRRRRVAQLRQAATQPTPSEDEGSDPDPGSEQGQERGQELLQQPEPLSMGAPRTAGHDETWEIVNPSGGQWSAHSSREEAEAAHTKLRSSYRLPGMSNIMPNPDHFRVQKAAYGPGTADVNCPKCGGTGEMPRQYLDDRHRGSAPDCDLCEGEGSVPETEAHAWHTSSRTAGVRHTAPGGGEHAPYRIRRKGDGQYEVVNDLGEVKGTHSSKEEARDQQKALYASVPGARESAEADERSKRSSLRALCAKCRRGCTPDGAACGYCDGAGSLDPTSAALKAADGWDQGLVRISATGAVSFDSEAFGSDRWQKLPAQPEPTWIADQWGPGNAPPEGAEPNPLARRPAPSGRELADTRSYRPPVRASFDRTANPYSDDNPYLTDGPGMPGEPDPRDDRRAQVPGPADQAPATPEQVPLASGAAQPMVRDDEVPHPQDDPRRRTTSGHRDPAWSGRGDVVDRLAARVLAANAGCSPADARKVALLTLRRFPALREPVA